MMMTIQFILLLTLIVSLIIIRSIKAQNISSSRLVSSNHHKCDYFNGYWEGEVWHATECEYFKSYSKYKTLDEKRHYNMLFLGDSNSAAFLEDISRDFGLPMYWEESLKAPFTVQSEHLRIMKLPITSVFPYPSPVLNYCVEFAPRNTEGRTFFATNEEVIKFALEAFQKKYDRHPKIIEFAINFWEMVRMREEANCESGDIQQIAQLHWNGNILEEAFLHEYTLHLESHLRSLQLQTKDYKPIIFTKTFQIPRLEASGRASHTNLHSGNYVKQLNTCIRIAAKRVGVYLVDVERMTSFFMSSDKYLKDMIHLQPYVNVEIMNILWHWYDHKYYNDDEKPSS